MIIVDDVGTNFPIIFIGTHSNVFISEIINLVDFFPCFVALSDKNQGGQLLPLCVSCNTSSSESSSKNLSFFDLLVVAGGSLTLLSMSNLVATLGSSSALLSMILFDLFRPLNSLTNV